AGAADMQREETAGDTAKTTVRLQRGGDLSYDRLVVSPGVDFLFTEMEGYEAAMSAGRVLHAWKAGPQTVELRRQLVAMRDGGVYVPAVPTAPYRGPTGPYGRATPVGGRCPQAQPP